MLVWDTPVDEARALGRFLRGREEEREEGREEERGERREEERGEGHEMTREVEEMDRGWEKGARELKAEETVRTTEEGREREGRGERKRRCSSSWLSQPPGALGLRVECEVSESSTVAVTQRRPAKKTTGSEAPAKERMEEKREDIVASAL